MLNRLSDFYVPNQSDLPELSLKEFGHLFSTWNPELQHVKDTDIDELYSQFLRYRDNVLVCGCIMLNQSMQRCVLVKAGVSSKVVWSFPKGKINQAETDVECAIREVRLAYLENFFILLLLLFFCRLLKRLVSIPQLTLIPARVLKRRIQGLVKLQECS